MGVSEGMALVWSFGIWVCVRRVRGSVSVGYGEGDNGGFLDSGMAFGQIASYYIRMHT